MAASASAFLASACIWAAISTIVDEVSSVELDCASAPLAIWVVEAEISSVEVATVRDVAEIWPTILCRFLTICRIVCSSQPISSRVMLLMSTVRSPFETASAARPSRVSGSAISRARNMLVATPTTTAPARRARIMVRAPW